MPYTIHRNVQLLSIQQETVERRLRPQEIADPSRRRDNYQVLVGRFSDPGYSVAISDFRKEITPGQRLSIAVNDKEQLIALVNHSTGKTSCLTRRNMRLGDITGTLWFLAIPAVLCYAIARKAFSTVKYHDMGWYVLGAGALIIILVLAGINKEFRESRQALRELKQ